MEWIMSMSRALDYIENHLLDEELDVESISKEVAISSFYFQRGFSILTGYGVGEYIRNRRMYRAAIDIAGGAKVIDVALKYCYETPESFTKSFSRFHGVTPQRVKGDVSKIKVFLPLKINISITGGSKMDFRIEKMDSFKVIGFKKIFNMDDCLKKIPEFWSELYKKYYLSWCEKGEPSTPIEKCMKKNGIGDYGICMKDFESHTEFSYMVAGKYTGGEYPSELEVSDIPALTWAKFECIGPNPGTLQSVNREIFNNWLPTNGKYKISADYSIEWYSSEGDPCSDNYRSEIWIPVEEI